MIDWGRYDYDRWKYAWQNLFDIHKLAHNKREIKKIEISEEMDGAFAVVEIDTLWINAKGIKGHWKGCVCKVYTKMPDKQWKLIMHTGVLNYSNDKSQI